MNLGAALRVVWQGKLIILLCVLVALGGTYAWLKRQTPEYTARMVVGPAASELMSSGARSTRGGPLSFLGANGFGAGAVTEFERFMELKASAELAERLQSKRRVLQRVFVDMWDPEGRRWIRPDGLVAASKMALRESLRLPPWTPPSIEVLAEYLQEEIKQSHERGSSLWVLKCSNHDPTLAKQLLTWVHAETDVMIRERAMLRASEQIKYLEGKLMTISVKEHRDALVDLLSQQERVLMVIGSGLPYAAEIIEAPTVSEVPTWPWPIRALAIGGLAGLVIGFFIVFLWSGMRQGGTAALGDDEATGT